MKTVTFFTKPDCGLCARAEAVLDRVQKDLPFRRETVDITRDPAAFRRYCLDIPVVLVDGVEHARHALDAGALRAALRGRGGP